MSVASAVIVDANVVVGGLTANEASPVARILDGMLAAAFPFAMSEALLTVYRTVLVRPKLHGLTVAQIEAILTDLAQHAIVLHPQPLAAPRAPDPGDQLCGDLLEARADLVLVSGHRLLLQDPGMRGRVIAPQAFVAGIDA